ncbi:bifunctional diguanylate cyclase/phosphodiesterase [Catenovulum sediminis]|uniref:bifunctional diguanylate cyclase/phosphodiesterase n=1 Tax=Catenovulum sediminis TaxID=1740262 RepID=UPI001181749B|nr:EAL domain-containing protein [Catenovulum sediminis]
MMAKENETQSVITRKITAAEAEKCASEPIHLIGSIQPHGFVFVLDPTTLKIVQYSDNFVMLFNQYAKKQFLTEDTQILNTSIFDWIELTVKNAFDRLCYEQTDKVELNSNALISNVQWECVGHLAKQWILLEFVPTSQDTYDSFELISQMNRMVQILRSAQGTQELFDTITNQFQQYTQFDRVMMYRFLPDWSGEVVSEAVSEQEKVKFLHMRFPADDIPKQARELYTLNKVRVFANADAEPSKLIPNVLPDGQLLDQSYALLRSISNMHRIYLNNMGVKATLTLSIIVEGKLWGLVVFHHNLPKSPPNHVVSQVKLTCELFSETLSSYLMPAIQMMEITHLMAAKSVIEATFNKAKMQAISQQIFANALTEIHKIVGYDFIGIIYGDKCYCLADEQFKLLSKKTIKAIDKLFADPERLQYQSYKLHAENKTIPGLESMAGINAMRSKIPSDFYVFFGKKEVVKSIQWGGVPNTVNIVVKGQERHLEPRSSFALWREQVKGQCDYWLPQDDKILEYFFTSCRDFTSVKSNELLMKKLEQNAHYDLLTNLANRAYLKKFIDGMRQNSNKPDEKMSVLFIDLDNFKDVNDFMGHETGDRLLQTIAIRLKECSRPNDLVVRLGGDEFIIVFIHENQLDLAAIAEKVVTTVGEPILDHEHTIVITPSVGVISGNVQDIDFNEMLKRADIAMYSAKNKGKNGFHIFDSKDQEAFNKKAILTLDLRDYVNSECIELHFQPQCDFNLNLSGAEALARWKHPKFGYISPEIFIQMAEMNNLIKPLSLHIFKKACATLVDWRGHNLPPNFDTLSVNISPSLLLDRSFENNMMDILLAYGLTPSDIRLEITESIFMQNYELAIANLKSLRKLGFTIALDDFGTGFSSLNYLWKLPIDEVKIDKSFIANMSQDDSLFTMVESIIELCKKLKLEVVAEGVESRVEFNILKGLGCDTCQGYYYSKPLPSELFIEQHIKKPSAT